MCAGTGDKMRIYGRRDARRYRTASRPHQLVNFIYTGGNVRENQGGVHEFALQC